MAHVAILFPGQGSLTSDAGERAWTQWPELAERAAQLVGEDPFASAAATTASAQPAIFVASLAAWRERDLPLDDVVAMAGHSLGELSALAAAGAIEIFEALRLVVLRGRLMADAAEAHGDGTMLALLGGQGAQAARLAERHGVAVANDNAPGQIVLSGRAWRLERAAQEAREQGFKTLALDVAGAFHSPAMRSAVRPLLRALDHTPVREPSVPVVSCALARPFSADLRGELARAVVMPVRWRQTMQALASCGATEFVDVGPGRVLERLVRRNLEAAHAAA